MPPEKSVDTQETPKAVPLDTQNEAEAVVADAKKETKDVEEAVAVTGTKEELHEHEKTILPADESKQINTELLSNIKTELEKTTIGPEKTELLLSKIGELTPSTMASKIRTYAEGLNNA